MQVLGCCCHFFNQSSVLLGGMIHLAHSLAYLGDTSGLFVAGSTDFTHDVCHAFDGVHDLGHGVAGLIYQDSALLYPLHTGIDKGFDFLGSIGTSTGQATHFAGHHSKTTTLFTRPCGFNGCVQCQNIGLKCNTVNHTDDVGYFFGGVIDAFHGLNHLTDDLATLNCHGGCSQCQLIGLTRRFCVVRHSRTQLFHGGRRLLQRAGLLFGAG